MYLCRVVLLSALMLFLGKCFSTYFPFVISEWIEDMLYHISVLYIFSSKIIENNLKSQHKNKAVAILTSWYLCRAQKQKIC